MIMIMGLHDESNDSGDDGTVWWHNNCGGNGMVVLTMVLYDMMIVVG